MLVHLDTDFGGDPDDACALAFLLGTREVEIAAITTTLDADGRRAGCVERFLSIACRPGIPIAAGAGATLSDASTFVSTAADARYWPEPIAPAISPPGRALDLLVASIDRGATIVAIGPATNLALLEIARPGSLERANVVMMGGWIVPPAEGLPQWGPDRDFNVQCDARAMRLVADRATLTLVTLPATLRCCLRRVHLERLRRSGALGELLARQSELHATDSGKDGLGPMHSALPDDLVNFHYDPATCAVALGWGGATVEPMRLAVRFEGHLLRFEPSIDGRPFRVVTDLDGEAFAELWLERVAAFPR